MARILITGFSSFPSPSRLGVQLQHVIDALQNRHQVDVLCARSAGQPDREGGDGGARILRIACQGETQGQQLEAFRRALSRQLQAADYDVVHIYDALVGSTVIALQETYGYVTVWDVVRSTAAAYTDWATAKELERAEGYCLQHADLVLTSSQSERKRLGMVAGLAKIHVVPPGVNIDRFDWDTSPDTRPVVLYLGTLAPGHGLRVLLRALLEVALESDAVLVLAGRCSPTFAASLRANIDELELASRVRFLGEIPNRLAPQVIARASVCVAPAARKTAVLHGSFPTKLLEYLACQRAVVAPRQANVEQFIQDRKQALFFEPDSSGDLAAKIVCLLHDRALRDQLAKAGYALVRSLYAASNTRRSLRRAYEWLEGRAGLSPEVDANSTTSPFAELGLEVATDSIIHAPDAYFDDGHTVFIDELNEQPAEAGEVTQVEIPSLLAQETAQRVGQGGGGPLDSQEDEEPDPYTGQWTSSQNETAVGRPERMQTETAFKPLPRAAPRPPRLPSKKDE